MSSKRGRAEKRGHKKSRTGRAHIFPVLPAPPLSGTLLNKTKGKSVNRNFRANDVSDGDWKAVSKTLTFSAYFDHFANLGIPKLDNKVEKTPGAPDYARGLGWRHGPTTIEAANSTTTSTKEIPGMVATIG